MSRPRSTTSPPQVVTIAPDGHPQTVDIEARSTIHSPQESRIAVDTAAAAATAPSGGGGRKPSPDHHNHVRSPGKSESLDIANRRIRRSHTATSYRPKLAGRQWKPGQEPGIDPAGPAPGTAPVGLHERCEITVVDYSHDDIEVRELDNHQLPAFLDEPRDPSLKCRWINVNGLSWDVISLLGLRHNLHTLAIEDMLNRRNRTKADWYADHTYLVLPLQKLVHAPTAKNANDHPPEDHSDSTIHADISYIQEKQANASPSLAQRLRRVFHKHTPNHRSSSLPIQDELPSAYTHKDTSASSNGSPPKSSNPPASPGSAKFAPRTLQRYNGGLNVERTEYMEGNSALRAKDLAVAVEQVSIFLMADNTVISFFEASAEDIEMPILTRLSSERTVLRRTANASMLVQAILDAVIDLAIPVAAAYKDAMDELELNVLTSPAIKHTRAIYILISEIVSFRANIQPVGNLVDALRDHKGPGTSGSTGGRHAQAHEYAPASGVTINPTTCVYLGDVQDHILLITDTLDQMRRAADNMIDLIFNTISAFQNESMRQLTIVTIIFLPMSFMTGYFGMNFRGPFYALQFGDSYFWYIAAPIGAFTFLLLMRDAIGRWWTGTRARRHIALTRRKRLFHESQQRGKTKRA